MPRVAALPRTLAAVALGLAAATLSACGLQRAVLFPAPPPAGPPSLRGGTVLTIPSPEGDVHALYVAPPPGAMTVVYFHGNGEQVADAVPLAQHLRNVGLGALFVEYPGYGMSAGGRPSERSFYAAAAAALDYLGSALATPPAAVVLVGHSLGAGVATEMASRRRGARLVLLAPFTSVDAMAKRYAPILPSSLVVRDHFDNLSKATRIEVPVLVVHGTDDEVIPFVMGSRLAAAFPHGRLEAIAGGRHNDLLRTGDTLGSLVAFARGGCIE